MDDRCASFISVVYYLYLMDRFGVLIKILKVYHKVSSLCSSCNIFSNCSNMIKPLFYGGYKLNIGVIWINEIGRPQEDIVNSTWESCFQSVQCNVKCLQAQCVIRTNKVSHTAALFVLHYC